MFHRLRRIFLIILASLVGLVLLALLTGTFVFRGSLPRLSGQVDIAGLNETVIISRDALGVPDIQAHSRVDAALALGYLHGQDRFFQMDLLRRNSAGEMAALFGPAQVELDHDTRRHRFRHRAEIVLAEMDKTERIILEAYTSGVNAGLADLKSRPFEYLALRQKPAPWRPTDSILTLFSMFMDLSYSTTSTEEAWANVRDNLPPGLANMLLPRSNRWEAPLEDDPLPGIVIPNSADCDLRTWKFEHENYDAFRTALAQPPRHDSAGSNNWAVAGNLTEHGGALVANDMHLGHLLPNIWYRARMSWPENGSTRSVVGVTLPGIAMMVSGSNGEVAWGFTNSYGDWADLIILELDPDNLSRYLTPDGWQKITSTAEVIAVAGAQPDTLWVEETIWGPIWTTDTSGNRMVLRWTGHDTETVYKGVRAMETVGSVAEVVALSGSIGMPQQNLVCGDTQGNIAWTIAGFIPRRVGWDGRLPVSWADGTHRWDGYHEPEDQPFITNPAEGRLWTANSRVSSGAHLQMIGDGGYGLGARARQIRDHLRTLERPDEEDMLAVQLDDRAIFLAEWRGLVLSALESHKPDSGSPRDKFLQEVRDNWSGRANPESVSYRLVRQFTYECIEAIYGLLTRDCRKANPDFRTHWLAFRHAVTWEILAAEPANLLAPWWDDWDDFILQAVDRTLVGATSDGRQLSEYTWGELNVVEIAHPFFWFVPRLEPWLAASSQALPGDSFMPRVQHRYSGASERLVVSPGREELGILHMPGGQSGHPLSPFFLAGHEDWAQGRATALLPGPELHHLELKPEKDK